MKVDLSTVIARSASDKNPDWPVWMLWNGYLNVTPDVLDMLGIPRAPGEVFVSREQAEQIAAQIKSL